MIKSPKVACKCHNGFPIFPQVRNWNPVSIQIKHFHRIQWTRGILTQHRRLNSCSQSPIEINNLKEFECDTCNFFFTIYTFKEIIIYFKVITKVNNIKKIMLFQKLVYFTLQREKTKEWDKTCLQKQQQRVWLLHGIELLRVWVGY